MAPYPVNPLGYPVYVDANVASLGSNARVVIWGDWSSYYGRLDETEDGTSADEDGPADL